MKVKFICTNCGFPIVLDDFYIKNLNPLLQKYKCPVCGDSESFKKVTSTRRIKEIYRDMRKKGADPGLWAKILISSFPYVFKNGKLKLSKSFEELYYLAAELKTKELRYQILNLLTFPPEALNVIVKEAGFEWLEF